MAAHAATVSAHQGLRHDEGISRGMAGMVLFIASEIMLFGGLFAGYFYVRSQAAAWPPLLPGREAIPEVNVATAALLTVFLVSSSITAHVGLLGIKENKRQQFKIGIALSILLGTIFISGQIYEWFSLFDEGLTAKTSTYGSTFFIITGFHGAHVIAGLCMLWVVLVRAIWNDFTPRRHLFADAAVLYWHFVDVVWIFVFTIIYVSPKF